MNTDEITPASYGNITLTDAEFELADSVQGYLDNAEDGKTFTPSEVARKLRVDVTVAGKILQYMAAGDMIEATGNGARTRYAKRA